MLTLANLFCGSVAILYAVLDFLEIAALLVFLGIIFDFLDGFAARILKVQNDLGKQLDSLADVVTSGIVPSIFMVQLLLKTSGGSILDLLTGAVCCFTPWIGFFIGLASAHRLAKFNIDKRQSGHFIGLPTPANTLLIISLPLILKYNDWVFLEKIILNKTFLITLTFLSCYLLNAPIHLFSLKFKNFSWKGNELRYIFLILSLFLLLFLQFLGIPLILFFYILLSLFRL